MKDTNLQHSSNEGEKSAWTMDDGSFFFMGDYFPPLSTTAHWHGVGGRAETKKTQNKTDEGARLGLGE